MQMWIKEIRSLIFKTFTKPVIMLLTWHFIGTTIYCMLLPFILVYINKGASGVYVSLAFSIINILSPVAGYFGDLKYTRFRLLKCGTIFTIAATSILLATCLSLIVVGTTNPHRNAGLWFFMTPAIFVINRDI